MEKIYSILVVDDEKQSVQLLRRIFRQGYTVYSATSALEALNILAQNPVDLILTDQRMPKMTGLELLKTTYEPYPDLIRIILTAYADIKDLIEAINLGYVYRYITKPFDIEELRITVKRALESYELGIEKKRLLKDLTEKNSMLEQTLNRLQATQRELLRTERISAIGQMASYIIHDMKAPLSGIQTIAQMWEMGVMNLEKGKNLATKALKEIDGMNEMMQEILDFAGGTQRIHMEEMPIELFLLRFIDCLKQEITWDGIRIVSDIQCKGKVKMDVKKMTRVFFNLARNARDAIESHLSQLPKEAMFLKISAMESNSMIQIQVEDSGIGIAEEHLKVIFKEFFTRGKRHGTGLGLAIAQKVIEDHLGTITAQSKIGKGTIFSIEFPTISKVRNV